MGKKAPAWREEILRSKHKWYLGGGRALLWAPEFPQHLASPGFWDHAVYLDTALPRLFTVTFLEGAKPLALGSERGEWLPSHLTVVHNSQGLTITERRSLLPDDTLTSRLVLHNSKGKPRTLDVVQWGIIDLSPTLAVDDVRCENGRMSLACKHFTPTQRLNLEYRLTYALAPGVTSHQVAISEAGGAQPAWRLTPFAEAPGARLADTIVASGGIQKRQGAPAGSGQLFVALHHRVQVPARKRAVVTALCNVSAAGAETAALDAVLGGADPVELSVGSWESFFASVPEFRCSDPFIEKYYWYRWYGLRLNMVTQQANNLAHPCVFEGTNAGHFRHAVSYSAWCHMLETRWMQDPAVAQGSLLNFIANQHSSGSLPSRINTGLAETRASGIYHANWGEAVIALDDVRRDDTFLEAIYEGLTKYASYFDRERDKKKTNLYDVVSQNETGQEYAPRYLVADEKADEWGPFRLKGVDATVYMYWLYAALARIARRLARLSEGARWQRKAERTGKAIVKKMWNKKLKLFCDVNPETNEQSPVKSCTSFYPFLTQAPTKSHLAAFKKHLFNKDEFWTPFPAPSTSLDEELANPDGLWKAKRMRCPWNGRTWLMTNSHIAEAIGRAAIRFKDQKLRRRAVQFLRKFIKMLFLDGDIERPTSYEYYNPITGQPPYFRGVDDYMHSWIVDLIIKYVAGVRPSDGRLCVDPFNFGLRRFTITNLRIRGHEVEVHYRRSSGIKVFVDGHLKARAPKPKPIYLALD